MNSIVFESITSCQESVTIIFLDFQWIKHKGFFKKISSMQCLDYAF